MSDRRPDKEHYNRICLLLLLFLWILVLQAQPALAEADLTPEELVEYAPKNEGLAVVFMIVLFAVKSLIFIIPIPVLYLASGLIFDPVTAFLVNFIGMMVCTAVPYWIGRFSGAGLFQRLIKKYPKLQILDTFQHENQWFVCFMARAIGFLPCDAVSLVLGAWKTGFWRYLSGTALGMLPGLITTTMVGITVTDPGSPGFLLSVILAILVAAGSFLFWRTYQKTREPDTPQSTLAAGLDLQHEEDQDNEVGDEQKEGNEKEKVGFGCHSNEDQHGRTE
ncbi:MAG TPA: hypothetical protein GX017_01580 [Clostridiales bacterium]|jgi:uncharacterized membrane protein YdjX (TVP38/TMEM64 family)|nr:hypothetical protein [Clostridiales bacterium]